MASESGFAVFGAVGALGEGIPSEPEPPPPVQRWWKRVRSSPTTHVGIAAPTRLLTKTATELKPGRFLLYITAATLLLVGLFGAAIYVPSASVTLIAQAAPFTQKDVEIQATPASKAIHVRANVISKSSSQGFKTTGSIVVPLAPSQGAVAYTNSCPKNNHTSPGIWLYRGQRLDNTNGITFAQTSADTMIPWQSQPVNASVIAVQAGSAGNVGSGTITAIESNTFSCLTVSNPQATGGGTDPSTTPQMTESDFDAGRAQLEQELHQAIAQTLVGAGQPGEKLSETIIYGAPQYTTDHQPNDKVPTFSGTMTITGEGDFYSDSDVQKAYQAYLAQRVPNNQQLLTESPIQVQYRILNDTSGGNMTFVGSAAAYVAPRLDEAQIRSQIVGRPLAQARFYLERLPIRSVNIKEQPLSLPLMPLLIGRISLHYIVQSSVPAATAAGTTPAASPAPSP
jgi:Baseplate J-like protein